MLQVIVKTPTQPQLTQPKSNITSVGLETKMTLHTTTQQKLNNSNILAVTDLILMKPYM